MYINDHEVDPAGMIADEAAFEQGHTEYNARWIEQMKSNCVIAASGCWVWQRQRMITAQGYARCAYRGKPALVHRRLYQLVRGVTLDRRQFACHSCDVRRCINPDHIWIGSALDNQLDMSAKKRARDQTKTHCKHGHAFTVENTRWKKRKNTSVRDCIECDRIRQRVKHGWPRWLATSHPYMPVGQKHVSPRNTKRPEST